MWSRISLILWLWVVLLVLTSPVAAQTIMNPSFEDGLTGWTTYSYMPDEDSTKTEPTVGCSGFYDCTFDLLNPPYPADGYYVCGIQSSSGINGNGGVCQSFDWAGGPTTITVSGHGYSEPYDNGCRVRMGLADGYTEDRDSVTDWVVFPQSSAWSTQQLTVPGPGIYTIFIEAYQPSSGAVMSTLWDNVQFGTSVSIASGPEIAPDPSNPETAVIVTWTTNAPSTSRVDYGTTTEYGLFVESAELTMSHTITLTGLEHPRTYHCRVTSTSGDYSTSSGDNEFTTPGVPLAITDGPHITPDPSNPETAATVTWSTDELSTSQVDFGTTPDYGRVVSSTELTMSHTVALTGLTHSTTYHCRVRSASGEYIADSADTVFTTPIQMTNLTVTHSPGSLLAYVSWQTTDVDTDAQVEYWPTLGEHVTITEAAPLAISHQVVLDVVLGKEYHFRATSQGSSPYTSVSANGKFFSLPLPSNALLNGGFEDVNEIEEPWLYPWVQYTNESPSYSPIDGLIGPYPRDGAGQWNPENPQTAEQANVGIRAYNGSYFLGTAANWDKKNGGVFQQVNVIPNHYYVLSARFITYRWGGEDGYNKVKIGVDPNGGIDPNNPGVKWWTGYSDTNNNLWHTASLTVTSGSGGVATVFLEFHQIYDIEWHIAAVDGVSFYPPDLVSIGALKASQSSLGAILENKIVTYASPTSVWCRGTEYMKAYIEEENRSSGVAVLFPMGCTDYPVAGNKLTVTGALAEYNKEAAVMAMVDCWTVDHGTYTLPKALALSQKMIGTTALNQPPVFSHNIGLCTIGLRVRVCGRVTWVSSQGDPGDVIAYVDDGGGIADACGLGTGVRVYLPGKGSGGVWVGDYVAATGVLSIELTNSSHEPGVADLYAYSVFTNLPEDWMLISGH